jgi:hypothetical protein
MSDASYPGQLAFPTGFLEHLEEPVPTRMPDRIFNDTESTAGTSEPHTPASLLGDQHYDAGTRGQLLNFNQTEGDFGSFYEYLQPDAST